MKNLFALIAALVAVLGIAYGITFSVVRSNLGEAQLQYMWIDKSGTWTFTAEVPLEEGVTYGWLAAIRATKPPQWTEEFTIPEAPATWENADLVSVSEDRKTATCSNALVLAGDNPYSGLRGLLDKLCFVNQYEATHVWSVVPGDPPGDYRFTVTISGRSFKGMFLLKQKTVKRSTILDPEERREDLFSYANEKTLSINGSYSITSRMLTVSISNVTDVAVSFDAPQLVTSGNVHLRGEGFFYPPMGSGIIHPEPTQILGGATRDFTYLIPEGGVSVTKDAVVALAVFLSRVNGEKKRTPFKCQLKILE